LAPSTDNQARESAPEWDVFISHASEDKQSVARPLAEELIKRGVAVWYDDLTLRIGDSLRRSIDQGLARSRFGIVILSPAFFRKEWPQTELDGLAARQSMGQKVILPVWHHVTYQDVLNYSPTLADRLAANTSAGIESVVDKLLDVIAPEQESGNEAIPAARFSDDLTVDRISIKVVMNALLSDAKAVKVNWPSFTRKLIEKVSALSKELPEYYQSNSRFHAAEPEFIMESYGTASSLKRYAEVLTQNVPKRVPLLWKGMRDYWGGHNHNTEQALINFLLLANSSIQLKSAWFVLHFFPELNSNIPHRLAASLKLSPDPAYIFECVFQTGEPIYAAEIHEVGNMRFNHYVYGPKSKILEAYDDFTNFNLAILNDWYSRQLIPQTELILAEAAEVDRVIAYNERARINKIRDENFEEVEDDPRPLESRGWFKRMQRENP
jgi:hypothetical protein